MRAPLSIVIPTLNAAEALPATLKALVEGLGTGLIRELIVSDGGSSDATTRIAVDAGATVVSGAQGRGGQLARGADAAHGEWLLFLHADTVLAPGWAIAATDHIRDNPALAAYFRLRFRAHGLAPALVAAWGNARARLFGLPYGDQGLLMPRDLYDRVGGYSDIPLMEDVEIARALGRRRIRALKVDAATSADRYRRDGWVRRSLANGWLLGRFLAGADPARLARTYHRESAP